MTTVKPKKVVREIMDRDDWTLARLGRKIGFTREWVRQMIDREEPPADGRDRIAAALGVKPSELVDAEGRWRTL